MEVVKQCFALPYLELPVEFTSKNYCIKNFSSAIMTYQMMMTFALV